MIMALEFYLRLIQTLGMLMQISGKIRQIGEFRFCAIFQTTWDADYRVTTKTAEQELMNKWSQSSR